MCRFVAYVGNPLILDEILFKPSNSLIKQSVHAKETKEPLNGDGFGLGWYAQDIDSYPGIFKSIQPAWNDLNLAHLVTKLRSNCFLAHIRSASVGGVSQFNCHPFKYHQYLFMHNGTIGHFNKIIRYLRQQLSDEFYGWIQGQTDSEHLFAYFLHKLNQAKLQFNVNNAAKILMQTIHDIEAIQQQHNCATSSRINTVISNGKTMIACRYISNQHDEAASLHYAFGSHYEYHNGVCHIVPATNGENGAILIASEQLTHYKAEWKTIPVNHMLLVDEDLSTTLIPCHDI